MLTSTDTWISGLAVIDFDGDGSLDICFGMQGQFGHEGTVYVFRGPAFAPTPDVTIGYPTDIYPSVLTPNLFADGLSDLGDIDADGWSDLGVNYGERLLIYNGGPLYDTLYDYHVQYRCYPVAAAGDINGDGHSDLVGYGKSSSFGSTDVYLAGPVFDTVMDDQILRSDLPPWYLNYIGYSVSPAGDFNGDGYDDFLFACGNFADGWRGAVFVVAGGPNIVTDVVSGTDSTVPNAITLRQNYPNPFNLETTIEFDLPRWSKVEVTVLNPLGQVVRRLAEREMSAGKHRISWDGRDGREEAVASGVYLYRVKTGESVQSRTMVLVK